MKSDRFDLKIFVIKVDTALTSGHSRIADVGADGGGTASDAVVGTVFKDEFEHIERVGYSATVSADPDDI